jgi:hypothetical protein
LQEILEEPSVHHAEDDSARGYSAYSTDGKVAMGKPAEVVDAPKDVTMSKDTADGMV